MFYEREQDETEKSLQRDQKIKTAENRFFKNAFDRIIAF
jgi:hypothetical protein